jgi:hypothetical protein
MKTGLGRSRCACVIIQTPFRKAVTIPTMYKYKYDFEVGHLIKSPCKECDNQGDIPECIKQCKLMEEIQTILAETVSCSRRM